MPRSPPIFKGLALSREARMHASRYTTLGDGHSSVYGSGKIVCRSAASWEGPFGVFLRTLFHNMERVKVPRRLRIRVFSASPLSGEDEMTTHSKSRWQHIKSL